MNVIPIELGERSYDIEIESNSLSRVGVSLASLGDASRVVLITDDNVEPLYGEIVSNSIVDRGLDLDVAVIPAGEESKSIEVAYELWNQLLNLKVDRRSVVVALGGGVVGDLSGFVAATYARGIRYFQVPTTLLAQVDSSVGGKTAIDLPQGKNMVGAFHQPCGVLIDPVVLQSLSEEQYRAGLGEVVKYAASLDADFFEILENNVDSVVKRDPDILVRIVGRCCQIKANVVRQDERETSGLRALLNYGHTFGHALETTVGYGKLLHGYAVALGSVLAAKLAFRLASRGDERFKEIDQAWITRQNNLISALGLPTTLQELQSIVGFEPNIEPENLVALTSTDKKAVSGKLNFVLPVGLGKSELVRDVAVEDVLAVFN